MYYYYDKIYGQENNENIYYTNVQKSDQVHDIYNTLEHIILYFRLYDVHT